MPLRGAGEIREDPFERNRGPRDRPVEIFRAGVELDPERAAPGLEQVVRLSHLFTREARAVRDEPERNVLEPAYPPHAPQPPRHRQTPPHRPRPPLPRAT